MNTAMIKDSDLRCGFLVALIFINALNPRKTTKDPECCTSQTGPEYCTTLTHAKSLMLTHVPSLWVVC